MTDEITEAEYWSARAAYGRLSVAPRHWVTEKLKELTSQGVSREEAGDRILQIFSIEEERLLACVMDAIELAVNLSPEMEDDLPIIVDIGVGPGELPIKLGEKLLNGRVRYLGIDVSSRMLDLATSRLRDMGLDGETCRLIQGDITGDFQSMLEKHIQPSSIWMIVWGKLGLHLGYQPDAWARALTNTHQVIPEGGWFLLYEPLQDSNPTYARAPRKSERTVIRSLRSYESALSNLSLIRVESCRFVHEIYSVCLWRKPTERMDYSLESRL